MNKSEELNKNDLINKNIELKNNILIYKYKIDKYNEILNNYIYKLKYDIFIETLKQKESNVLFNYNYILNEELKDKYIDKIYYRPNELIEEMKTMSQHLKYMISIIKDINNNINDILIKKSNKEDIDIEYYDNIIKEIKNDKLIKSIYNIYYDDNYIEIINELMEKGFIE